MELSCYSRNDCVSNYVFLLILQTPIIYISSLPFLIILTYLTDVLWLVINYAVRHWHYKLHSLQLTFRNSERLQTNKLSMLFCVPATIRAVQWTLCSLTRCSSRSHVSFKSIIHYHNSQLCRPGYKTARLIKFCQ
jgi:hypothetical protein